ncbi:galactoside 2-alpha-L-fucosyltransferase [Amborella trichopoda]|uniref:Fucosyltransferase n=1 Tax=Amborella trichopoda TaxID=13333 RepID=U5D350_AMBTC|nr:galactoside 2-alpha-L-fucosyltransferase [Amborella trichopoda]ERN15847.1 hypothetical protein AMTR_s00039p00172790 [Amborella trichopoda]|eukprot:XP_006854380.1 galactoside 2-alpha-L-fucosyltransferase [Amborella trichopoda]
MTSLILLLLLLLSSLLSPSSPVEFRDSLSDLSQQSILHCSTLTSTDKLLCEFAGAIDDQGNPATRTPTVQSSSCKFKEDGAYNAYYPYATSPSQELTTILEKYFSMHQRCVAKDLATLANAYSSGGRPLCQYVIWGASGDGLGNRLMSLMSAFLYSILSARVLLIDYPEWRELFCEPFLGSTISIPQGAAFDRGIGAWNVEFLDAKCGSPLSSVNNGGCNNTIVKLSLDHDTPLREYDFVMCPLGYSRLRNVPFVTIRECNQYLVPGFYANPVLTPLMDLLFPERNVFHVLSRYLLSPSDPMWHSIRDDTDVQASRRIGIQIREFQFEKYTSEYDDNIVRCLWERGGILPRRFRKGVCEGEYLAIHVATLEKGHVLKVNETMKIIEEETGVEARVSRQAVDGREAHDAAHQEEALIDIWVLSMSHVLITSIYSTFGYVASALSGVAANFIDKREGESCKVSNGVEPCFHAAPKLLVCSDDELMRYTAFDLAVNSSWVRPCADRIVLGWTLAKGTSYPK